MHDKDRTLLLQVEKKSFLKPIRSKKDISSITLENLVSNLKICRVYQCCYFPKICRAIARGFYTVYDKSHRSQINTTISQYYRQSFSCSLLKFLSDVLFAARKYMSVAGIPTRLQYL